MNMNEYIYIHFEQFHLTIYNPCPSLLSISKNPNIRIFECRKIQMKKKQHTNYTEQMPRQIHRWYTKY